MCSCKNTEIFTTIKNQRGLCDDIEGWDGETDGREGTGCTYGWFLLMFDRKQQSSVKQLSFYLKIKWQKNK